MSYGNDQENLLNSQVEDHFLYFQELYVWLLGDNVRKE